MKTKLNQSRVEFNELEHTYQLDGKSLRGITGIIDHYINNDKFANMSGAAKANANRKKEYGSQVHDQLEMLASGFKYADELPEVTACKKLFKQEKIKILAAEYLVSDEKDFASKIDMVDEDLNLYDYKTSTTLDIQAIRWQLSIYSIFFMQQNAGLTPNKLYCIHLHDGKAERIEIQPIMPNNILYLLDKARANDEDFVNPLTNVEETDMTTRLMNDYKKNIARITELQDEIAKLQETNKSIEEVWADACDCRGVKELTYGNATIKYTPSIQYQVKAFDKDKFIKEHAKMYYHYETTRWMTRGSKVEIKFND